MLFACAAAAPAADDTWYEIRSQNFVLAGDAPERELLRAVNDLEAFRAALSKLYPGLELEAPLPTWVVIFKDNRRFQRFLPRDARGRPIANVGGYFLSDPDAHYIVLGKYGAEFDRQIVLHEYAHYMLHRRVRTLPMWLNEGLAEFYSTFDRHRTIAPGNFGRPPADLLKVLRSQEFIPLEQIIALRNSGDLSEDGERVRMFYAESWALVHYLTIGRKGASTAGIGAFIAALDRAAPPEQAFADAFGETIDEVDVKLRTYIQQSTYKGMAVEAGAVPAAPITVEPMRAADLRRLHGDLLLRVGRLDEAEQELSVALADEPSNVEARIAMARTKLAGSRCAEGLAALHEIATANPLNFAAQYYLGGALAVERRYYEAFAAYDNAVLLRNNSAAAWFAFSTLALALSLDDAAEASLDRAMQLEFDPASYRARAYLAFGFGRNRTAAADARRYIQAVGLREPEAQTVAFVAAIAYWRTRQPGDAEALLEQVRAAVPSSSWNAAVVQFMQGRVSAERLLSRAKDQAQKTAAHTYIGLKAAIEGRESDALVHFRWVRDLGAKDELGYGIAIEELVRIEALERK